MAEGQIFYNVWTKISSYSRTVLKGNNSSDHKSVKVKKLLPSTRIGLMELLVS